MMNGNIVIKGMTFKVEVTKGGWFVFYYEDASGEVFEIETSLTEDVYLGVTRYHLSETLSVCMNWRGYCHGEHTEDLKTKKTAPEILMPLIQYLQGLGFGLTFTGASDRLNRVYSRYVQKNGGLSDGLCHLLPSRGGYSGRERYGLWPTDALLAEKARLEDNLFIGYDDEEEEAEAERNLRRIRLELRYR